MTQQVASTGAVQPKFKVGDRVINTNSSNASRLVTRITEWGYDMEVLDKKDGNPVGGMVHPSFQYAHYVYILDQNAIIDKLLDKYK